MLLTSRNPSRECCSGTSRSRDAKTQSGFVDELLNSRTFVYKQSAAFYPFQNYFECFDYFRVFRVKSLFMLSVVSF